MKPMVSSSVPSPVPRTTPMRVLIVGRRRLWRAPPCRRRWPSATAAAGGAASPARSAAWRRSRRRARCAMPSLSTVAARSPRVERGEERLFADASGDTTPSAVMANRMCVGMIEDMIDARKRRRHRLRRLPRRRRGHLDAAPPRRGRRSRRRRHRARGGRRRGRALLRRRLVAGLAVLVAGAGVWAATGGVDR